MGTTSVDSTGPEQGSWQPTAEQEAEAEAAVAAPMGAKTVAKVLLRSPRIIPDAFRLALSAGYTGMWSSSGLRALLNSERVLQAVPGVARGAAHWAGLEPFVGTVTSRLRGDEVALELGCGSGRVSRHIAPKVGRLCCSDVSSTMLHETRRTLGAFGNVEYALLDGRTLARFDAASFDVVYAHAVFYFFDLVPALGMLDEIQRVLRPGGWCILSFRTIDEPASAEVALRDARVVRNRGLGSGRFRPYTRGQIEALYELVGLRVVAVETTSGGDRSAYIVVAGEACDR
jgi:SAM-dependent methyltransferase